MALRAAGDDRQQQDQDDGDCLHVLFRDLWGHRAVPHTYPAF